MAVQDQLRDLKPQLDFQIELNRINAMIHSAPTILDIVDTMSVDISKLLGCERLTIYALDTKNKQLFSIFKVGDQGPKTIRVARDSNSIAGFCTLSRKSVNVRDVYDADELQAIHANLRFDGRWDRAMGFRTTQVLAVPLMFEKYLLGVLQLINKADGQPFSNDDQRAAEEIAKTLAIAFYNQNKAKRAATGKRSKFSDLIDRGLLSEKDLEAALTYARVNNRGLGSVLIEQHDLSKEDVGKSLSDFYNCPFFFFDGERRIPAELRENVDLSFWRKFRCAPLERIGRALKLAVVDPFDLTLQDMIKSTGMAPQVEPLVALDEDILAYLNLSYGKKEDDKGEDVEDELAEILTELESEADSEGDEEDGEKDDEEDDEEVQTAVVRLANKIIAEAYKQGVSDIHIEPNGGEAPVTVRFRRDGQCFVWLEVPSAHRTALVSRLKIMSQLDISEKRKPQDGKIRTRLNSGEIIELRVATLPTTGGNEDVVMRILASSKPLPIEALGMSPRNLEEFKKAASTPYGIILCVGPTGSGKTTTLHSCLGYLNEDVRKIWTAEDPVEITQAGLRQVQVRAKIGLTFAACMRAFLRADPDIIMIGEMRDEETASIGIEASLTGHLVLSTLHTNSAPETITRLLDMGLDPFNFADAVLGILAQRLVRTLCKSCKESYRATAEELDEMGYAYGDGYDKVLAAAGDEIMLCRPKGCDACAGSGYRGRMGLHELLVGSDDIKRAILQTKTIDEIRQIAMREGMSTLLQDGIQKVFAGHADFKQVRSVCVR